MFNAHKLTGWDHSERACWSGLDAHGMFQQGLPCCCILPSLLYSLRFCHHMSYRGMAHRPCLSQAQKFLHLFQRTSQG